MSRPIKLYRGASFKLTVTLDPSQADGYFATWVPLAQVRVAGNRLPAGVIDTLDWQWVDSEAARSLIVSKSNTDDWPTGMIEVDVLMTSPSGDYVRSPRYTFELLSGVTDVIP